MRLTDAVLSLVSGRESARPVAALRVALSAASLIQLAELVPTLAELAAGSVIRTPMVHEAFRLSASVVPWWTALWAVTGLASLLGWRPGLSVPALAVVQVATLLQDQQLYSNHFYLLTLLTVLLACTEGTRAPETDPEAPVTVASWPAVLMRTQLTSVYLFAGLSKINPDFLGGKVLQHYLEDSALGFRTVWYRTEVLAPAALAVVAIEIFVALGLWWPRTRGIAKVVGVLFHVSILVSLGPTSGLVIFAIESVAVYPLFLGRPQARPQPIVLSVRS